MRILCIDQAAHGGYSVWDYESRQIIKYNYFNFSTGDYNTKIYKIAKLIRQLIDENDIEYVVFEDVQFQRNVQTLKKLSQLQGSIIYALEEINMGYTIVPPKTWQAYIKSYNNYSEVNNISKSKELSLGFSKDILSIQTKDNNISDAICIGFYAVNNIDVKN